MKQFLVRNAAFCGAALLTLTALKGTAQTDLSAPLPIDPQVKVGKLANGLTYYIRPNAKPEHKVELRLVVNAGSILEDEDQRGLAHFSEHMAFNGTKHFQKNQLVSFLQGIGVEFGADLNAYTSFDETVYILPIPTDKPGNLDSGFQIIEDWAHNVLDEGDDIDDERPVILEESRMGKGAGQRMRDKYFPTLFAGSKYAERIPIGLDTLLKTFPYDAIRRFYRDWYRPDLMAVIVVGDISVDKAEALINQHFGSITNPANERPRAYADVPARTKSEAMVVTDKEATNYSVELLYSVTKIKPTTTLGDYKQELVKSLFGSMLNQRLAELTQKENPPYLRAEAGFEGIARGYETFGASATVGKEGIATATNALVQELERVKKYGFTENELERVKKSFLNAIERGYNERTKTESADYTDEYLANFLSHEPIPGIENEYKYYKTLLPGITVAEVSAVADRLKQNDHMLVLLTGPEKAAFQLPTNDELLAMADNAAKADVKPYEEKVIASDLIKKKPQAGKIVSEKKDAVLGTTELRLSNGVVVTLKSTDFKNDQVLLSGFRKGGLNNYGTGDKYNATFAATIVGQMGVGDFSPSDLKKANAGKTVSVSPQLGGTTANFNGNSSVKDLESMLQLVYLYSTQPRKDTALFNAFKSKQIASVQFILSNPQAAFVDTMYKVYYQGNPLAPVTVPRPEHFQAINLDRSLAIYKEQFGDAAGFNFLLVGNFNIDSIKPLLAQYLGALPTSSKTPSFKDNGVRPIAGDAKLSLHKGKDKKSLILQFYNTETPYSEATEMAVTGVNDVLNIRIIETLREKIGGIYSGGIYSDVSKTPYGNCSLVLQLPCNPDKVDTLLSAFDQEVAKLQQQGPTAGDLEKVKTGWKEKYRTESKQNDFWIGSLRSIILDGADVQRVVNYEKFVDALTAKQVQEAAQKFLQRKERFTAILYPED